MAVVDKWQEIKKLVESLEIDVLKSDRGNASAGVRVRKGLRLLKQLSSGLVKESMEAGKVAKAEKAEAKAKG